MKFRVKQNELSKAMNNVQKIVTSRTTMPILTGILIESENNQLHLTATDLEIGIKTTIDCETEEPGAIVVNAKLLGDFVRKLPSKSEILISTDHHNKMELKCMKSDFVILCNSAEEYPDNTFYNEGESIKINSYNLKKLIRYTSFAAAQDNIKPIFTGCLFEIENNLCSLIAIDGYRLAIKKERIEYNTNLNAIVPSKSLQEVYRILEEEHQDIEIVISKTHISFIFDKTIIISNLLEGEFIKYRDIIKEGFITKVKINTFLLRESIERVSLLSKEDKNNLIIMSVEDNNIKIESTSEYGNAEENIEVEVSGENLKIGFNSKYILDLLRIVEEEELVLNFQGSLNPCIIKLEDKEDYIYLVLPVRIS